MAQQEVTDAEQQKEIKALAAIVKEQALLIQKVNDKVELNRPAPQTVLNNQYSRSGSRVGSSRGRKENVDLSRHFP